MKTPVTLCFALLAFTPVHAQIFGPRSLDGALLGGMAGAVIGHNSGSLSHNGWQGAAIGAGAGALLGAVADNRAAHYNTQVPMPGRPGGYVYRNSPAGHLGYRGTAFDSMWLGALAGGIIGHNSGGDWRHNAWRGAAWGAGAGWLLGSLLGPGYDYYDYSYPRRSVVPAAQPIVVQTAPAAPAPPQVTIINNYYGNTSPMAAANALFGR